MAFENETTSSGEMTPRKSSGVAKAGLTLGIIGTALGALTGGGFLSENGLFGGGNKNSEISTLEAKIAELEGKAYTDAAVAGLYQNIVGVREDMAAYIADLDKRTALNRQAMELNREYDNTVRNYEMVILNNKIDNCCEKANLRIDYNKQLGDLADASILSYVNSNFISGQLYLPASSIVPPVVPPVQLQ